MILVVKNQEILRKIIKILRLSLHTYSNLTSILGEYKPNIHLFSLSPVGAYGPYFVAYPLAKDINHKHNGGINPSLALCFPLLRPNLSAPTYRLPRLSRQRVTLDPTLNLF